MTSIEMLSDTGANCFVVNNPEHLHEMMVSTDTAGVTGGSTAKVNCKGIIYLGLASAD